MSTQHRIPGLALTDHEYRVPLDHGNAKRGEITVFAREVVAIDKLDLPLPWLVFLQGGPGYEAPRPLTNSGWLKRALQEFRVVLLDQRGTGRSTPVHGASVLRIGDPEAQAAYLACFRQEQIIRDCEWIRRRLCGESTKWTVLGQSWGGYLATHYLSVAPEGLEAALFTGGLPPLTATADDVYRATYRRTASRNARYFERYPEDRELLRHLLRRVGRGDVRLSNGDPLTPRRVQQLGMVFGMSDGFETVHYLLEGAFLERASSAENDALQPAFLLDIERSSTFERNPIYALLQEAIYAHGSATRWSADRIRGVFPEFDDLETPLFTGEMVYPWMFDEMKALVPMREAAHLLAERTDWGQVYDPARLRENTVPAAAAIYTDDLYVEARYSEDAAATIRGLRPWITNEYDHNGLRADGEKILDRLLGLARGAV